MPVTLKWLALYRNRLKFWTWAILVAHIWGSIDLVIFKVILGHPVYLLGIREYMSKFIYKVLLTAAVKQIAKVHGPLVKDFRIFHVYHQLKPKRGNHTVQLSEIWAGSGGFGPWSKCSLCIGYFRS